MHDVISALIFVRRSGNQWCAQSESQFRVAASRVRSARLPLGVQTDPSFGPNGRKSEGGNHDEIPHRLLAVFGVALLILGAGYLRAPPSLPRMLPPHKERWRRRFQPGEPAHTIVLPGRCDRSAHGRHQPGDHSSDVLPLLARNAFLYGHQLGKQTEYMILAERYVQLARELQPLAGPMA